MPELRQEDASIHIYIKTIAVGGGGKLMAIMVENLWVENVQLHPHRMKG